MFVVVVIYHHLKDRAREIGYVVALAGRINLWGDKSMKIFSFDTNRHQVTVTEGKLKYIIKDIPYPEILENDQDNVSKNLLFISYAILYELYSEAIAIDWREYLFRELRKRSEDGQLQITEDEVKDLIGE